MSVTGAILTPGVVFAPRRPVLPRFPLQPEGLFRDGTAGALMDASALALAGRALFYTDAGNTAAEPGENIHTFLDTARARLWSSGAAYHALEGSHATQATTSQQPVVGSTPSRGVVNEFTSTDESFYGWLVSESGAWLTKYYAPSPITGEMTAARFNPAFETDPGSASRTIRAFKGVPTAVGDTRCFSLAVKPIQPVSRYPNPPGDVEEDRDVLVGLLTDVGMRAYFNCRTMSVDATGVGTEAGVIPLGDGWYRVWAAYTADNPDSGDNHFIYFSNRSNGFGFDPYPDGTEDILFSDPQTELVDSLAQGPSGFQVTDANYLVVIEPGVPSFNFLRYDTVDDKLSQVMPDGLNGDVMIFGRNGSWIDTGVTIAPGGTLTAINGADSMGTAGIIPVLGDIVGWIALDRTIRFEEQAELLEYYAKRGASGLYALGPELVVNGTFNTDSDWTKGAGWTISGGQAVRVDSGTDEYLVPTDTSIVEAGSSYLVSFTATKDPGGGLLVRLGIDATAGNILNAPTGTTNFKKVVTPANSGSIYFRAYTGNSATIDNVSIRKLVQS